MTLYSDPRDLYLDYLIRQFLKTGVGLSDIGEYAPGIATDVLVRERLRWLSKREQAA